MSRTNINPYELIFYALLHDIGKPIQRFAKKYVEKIEAGESPEKVEETVQLIQSIITHIDVRELAKRKHNEISNYVFQWFLGRAPSNMARELVKQILSNADPLAAAERGYEVTYKNCVDILVKERLLERISEELSRIKGVDISYNYYTAPFLSPLWMALITNYLEHVGPKAYAEDKVGQWIFENNINTLYKELNELLKSIKECNIESIKNNSIELLKKLIDKEIWLSINPLTSDYLRKLKTMKYDEAFRESSYASVVKELLRMLINAKRIYNPVLFSLPRSVIDTVLAIMRSTVFLTPSSVFASIVPDISLYSHSKVVTAYAASEIIGGVRDRYRLLVIDVNGIQQFVSASIKAAAASRMLRGRSLLVDLVLDSITHYVLEVFGGLPLSNVLVSEGGTIEFIVPDRDIAMNINVIRKITNDLSSNELGYNLGFTIAYSEAFNSSKGFFLHALMERKGFTEILDSLTRNLAFEKAKRGVRSKVLVKDHEIEGFDSLTKEVVVNTQRYKLRINASNKEYADLIAGPDKLSPGNVLSEASHLSLIAGSCARNLVAIISIYLYEKKDGYIEPSKDYVEVLTENIAQKICGSRNKLICNIISGGIKGVIGLIPLRSIGSIYILVSLTKPEPYDPSKKEDLSAIWILIYYLLDQVLTRELIDLADESNIKINLEFKIVNATIDFIPSPQYCSEIYDDLVKKIQELLIKGVDVVFNYILTNSYHPAKIVETTSDEKNVIKLVDLDEYGIIALAKIDCDMAGEVKRLLSLSPSRLATLSDMLNLVIAGKTYLQAIGEAKKFLEKGDKERYLLDVVPLYAGGDDVVVYGRWSHVIRFAYNIYSSIHNVVNPITLSLAIAIDRDNVPILELYERAVNLLENYAKRIKASCIIEAPLPRIIRINDKEVIINVIPVEKPSTTYPWPNDDTSKWNLEILAKIMDPFTDYISQFEKYKHSLYILLGLGAEIQKHVEKYKGLKEPLHDIVRLEIAYSYLWTRRNKEFKEIKKILNDLDKELDSTFIAFPEETINRGIREALRLLLASKFILDYVILAIRRKDTVKLIEKH